MQEIQEAFYRLKSMKKRKFLEQASNLALIVCTALMIWKSLMIVTNSESPVVVVLSGSMEPAYYRGDILFLHLYDEQYPITPGDVVVYKLDDREIPIVHRVMNIHGKGKDIEILTKGDNNLVNDRGLYPPKMMFLKREQIMGKVWGYMPYVGMITIWLNDYPSLKWLLIGGMIIVVLTSNEPQS